MDIYLDIWSCNIRHLHVCVNWICLLKSIKDNKNTNTFETKWIKKKEKKHYTRSDILEILFQNNYFFIK